MAQHYLKQMFNSRSIAVFGASGRPDAVGGRVLQNLKKDGDWSASHFKSRETPNAATT